MKTEIEIDNANTMIPDQENMICSLGKRVRDNQIINSYREKISSYSRYKQRNHTEEIVSYNKSVYNTEASSEKLDEKTKDELCKNMEDMRGLFAHLLDDKPFVRTTEVVVEHIRNNSDLSNLEKLLWITLDSLTNINFNETGARLVPTSAIKLAEKIGCSKSRLFLAQRNLEEKGYLRITKTTNNKHLHNRNIFETLLPDAVFQEICSKAPNRKGDHKSYDPTNESDRCFLERTKLFVPINYQLLISVFSNKGIKYSEKLIWLDFYFLYHKQILIKLAEKKHDEFFFPISYADLAERYKCAKSKISTAIKSLVKNDFVVMKQMTLKNGDTMYRKDKPVLYITPSVHQTHSEILRSLPDRKNLEKKQLILAKNHDNTLSKKDHAVLEKGLLKLERMKYLRTFSPNFNIENLANSCNSLDKRKLDIKATMVQKILKTMPKDKASKARKFAYAVFAKKFSILQMASLAKKVTVQELANQFVYHAHTWKPTRLGDLTPERKIDASLAVAWRGVMNDAWTIPVGWAKAESLQQEYDDYFKKCQQDKTISYDISAFEAKIDEIIKENSSFATVADSEKVGGKKERNYYHHSTKTSRVMATDDKERDSNCALEEKNKPKPIIDELSPIKDFEELEGQESFLKPQAIERSRDDDFLTAENVLKTFSDAVLDGDNSKETGAIEEPLDTEISGEIDKLNIASKLAIWALENYDKKNIKNVIDYIKKLLEKKKIENIQGYFVKALKEGWNLTTSTKQSSKISQKKEVTKEEHEKEMLEKEKNEIDAHIKNQEDPLWKNILLSLRHEYGDVLYQAWFKQLKFLCYDEKDRLLKIEAKNQFVADWVLSNYRQNILRTIKIEKSVSRCNVILSVDTEKAAQVRLAKDKEIEREVEGDLQTDDPLWKNILIYLRHEHGADRYNLHFKPLNFLGYDEENNLLKIEANSEFNANWISDNYMKSILAAARTEKPDLRYQNIRITLPMEIIAKTLLERPLDEEIDTHIKNQDPIWKNILLRLRHKHADTLYRTWFKPLNFLGYDEKDELLKIEVESESFANQLSMNHIHDILEVATIEKPALKLQNIRISVDAEKVAQTLLKKKLVAEEIEAHIQSQENPLWKNVLLSLRNKFGDERYDVHFKPLSLISYDEENELLTIEAETKLIAESVSNDYKNDIHKAIITEKPGLRLQNIRIIVTIEKIIQNLLERPVDEIIEAHIQKQDPIWKNILLRLRHKLGDRLYRMFFKSLNFLAYGEKGESLKIEVESELHADLLSKCDIHDILEIAKIEKPTLKLEDIRIVVGAKQNTQLLAKENFADNEKIEKEMKADLQTQDPWKKLYFTNSLLK